MEAAEIKRNLQATAQEIGKGIDTIHGPVWRARNELAKQLLTLTSATLVLTATLGKETLHGWPLIVSWCLIALAMIFSIFSIWRAIGLQLVPVRMINCVDDSEVGEITRDEMGKRFLDATKGLAVDEKLAKQHLFRSLACFVGGIGFLTIAAVLNFVK